jgi:hypothetical protein
MDYTDERMEKVGGVTIDDEAVKPNSTWSSEKIARDYSTKEYVAEQISNTVHLVKEIVDAPPTVDEAKENVIYMVKDDTVTSGDVYKEYQLINGAVVQTGDTSIDLSGYAKLEDVENKTEIDDTVTSTETTWSSEKIKEEIPKTHYLTGSNTEGYFKIRPVFSNYNKVITIADKSGGCIEIYGSEDSGYPISYYKAVRMSYGNINSYDASSSKSYRMEKLYIGSDKYFYLKVLQQCYVSVAGTYEKPEFLPASSVNATNFTEIPIIPLIPKKDFYRVVAQDKAGYFKFKPSSDGGNEQPLRTTATDNYGGMIEISGNAPSQDQYKPFKCVRLSNGTYASYDAANPTNNKMKKLYLYDGYMYLQVETYTTVTFTGLIEEPTFVETLADTGTEIPIVSLVNPSIKAATGSNINTVGTPSVTASESNGTTTFTFNYLKGAKGDTGATGTTPTIKAAAGSNINTVGTPSVTASTSGTTTTFTFNNLKGAKGDTGSNGTTPTIKASAGSNIGSVGTPSVSASTSGTTTTFTFNYLKGAKGDKGDTGETGATGPAGYKRFPSTPGVTTTTGVICSLDAKKVVVLYCIHSGGGSLAATSYVSGLTFNGSTWSSGTKAISIGSIYTIANTGSSTTTIKIDNNGGGGFLVFGPMS